MSHQNDSFTAIIEIASGNQPVKYELDKDTGSLAVDRFLSTAMFYPCNYGFFDKTLGSDGDPLDVLVVAPYSIVPGASIKVRPVGVLIMEDEAGQDEKILAVPVSKLTAMYDDIKDYNDLPKALLAQIKHFFEHYKDLESGKWVKVQSFAGRETALEIINKAAL